MELVILYFVGLFAAFIIAIAYDRDAFSWLLISAVLTPVIGIACLVLLGDNLKIKTHRFTVSSSACAYVLTRQLTINETYNVVLGNGTIFFTRLWYAGRPRSGENALIKHDLGRIIEFTSVGIQEVDVKRLIRAQDKDAVFFHHAS